MRTINVNLWIALQRGLWRELERRADRQSACSQPVTMLHGCQRVPKPVSKSMIVSLQDRTPAVTTVYPSRYIQTLKDLLLD